MKKRKLSIEEYLISSSHLKRDKEIKLAVIGDLHYHKNVVKDIYLNLLKLLKEMKPDFILLPGDLIETKEVIKEEKEKKYLKELLLNISKICPLIISPGNHEKDDFYLNKSFLNVSAIDFFEELSKYKNIYFLNNKQIKINNIMFLGLNPSLDYYYNYNKKESVDTIKKDYLDSKLAMNESDFNILLSHITPKEFKDKNKTDLTISAHWHDGYLPKVFDKFFSKTNVGLFTTPHISPFPGILCRGIHDFGRGKLVIAQGFRKMTADNKVFNFLEKKVHNDIELIRIRKK